jgi:deoxyuridine 5'-triphosphate nucleotidohydrolase
MENTLAIIKPDAVRNGLVGPIISAIERISTMKIAFMQTVTFTDAEAREFYSEHAGRHFFEDLVAHMTSGPSVAMILSGKCAIAAWRHAIGPTVPAQGRSWQLRFQYGTEGAANALHGSDSVESAQREIDLLFGFEVVEPAPEPQQPIEPQATSFKDLFDPSPVVKFQKIHDDAILPVRATSGSACWDIFAIRNTYLDYGMPVVVGTGWKTEIPDGYELQVRCRSGLSLKGVSLANGVGTVDSDYRGELAAIMILNAGGHQSYFISKGDKIAQIRLAKLEHETIEVVNELSSTDRGSGGFGSTGK